MDAAPNANNATSSSSTETNNNKKRNNHRRRNNNNKKAEDGKKARSSAANPNAQPSEESGKQQQQEKKPLKGFKKTPKEEEEQENDDPDGEVCFICTRPIDYYAVAPCDHRTCHLCTLRLRVLYKTKNCAYCKAEAKKVVFTNDSEKPYEDYKRDDTPFYDKKYGIRFETEDMYKDTMVLLQYNCPEQDCEEAFESWNELKRHVKQAHDRLCCDLCLRNKKIFSHEHTLYTQSQLQKHYREGDASFNKDDETGFTGHPECVFCRTRFYGADELFEHCRDKHEKCHLCERKGIQHQYYANYDSLEKHFKKDHFLCQYKECLDNKFVVFDSDIDLKAHEVKEHGNSLSRHQRAKQAEARRVDVNLNYGNNNSSNHRGGNATSRQQRNFTAEDFPDINGSVVSSLPSQMASASLSAQEQWPTLGEDTSASGRASPSGGGGGSGSETESGIVSRHAAALDRVADIFKNVEKVIKFRQATTKFTSLSSDVDTYVNTIFELCGKDAELTAKVLAGAKDLIDNRTLRTNMIHTWNKNSSLANSDDTSSPRVLVANPTSKQQRKQGTANKKKPGVWDKVASAAMDAGGYSNSSSSSSIPFPPIQSKTPWSGTSTPRTHSNSDLQQLFPALPSSAAGPSRRAELDNLLRKPNRNAWGESSSSMASESELSSDNTNNNDTNRKKKGKKGKQVLFRVGL
ncbi:hypothetical protein V8B55DRAFT_1544003 [Mucor lusitanicus]|uniref:RING-type E3 ubiquitin transferase n=1 Tax=Mucor circinelloides f. lusitanicus TaxID=29924 RepID=A0A8H4BEP1_MUCCL|nr:hypothetical protein FB192DRAFT_1344994 [Mucor lusitanicus]